MSTMCLVEECVDCRWYVMKGNKLDCNFENRLGLGKRGFDQFLEPEEEEEKALEEAVEE